MSVTVQGPDGNSYQFPDGTDKAAAISYFKKKGIGAKQESSVGGVLRTPTQRERFTTTYPVGQKGESVGENIKNAANNVGVGVFQTADALMNPIQTAKSILSSLNPKSDTPNPLAQAYQGVKTEPGEFLSNAAGQALGGAAIGEVAAPVARGVAKVIPKTARATAETLTGTRPSVVKDLVKDTQAENVDIAAKRKVNLTKHLEDTAKAKGSLNATANPAEVKTPVQIEAEQAAKQRSVKEIEPKVREQVEKARTATKAEADRRYNTQRAELNDKQVPFNPAAGADDITSENIIPRITEAWDNTITGTEGRPAIVKSISERINSAEPITWRDLQGYRSEIGKKLSGGNLPGDEFYAYKKMLGVIDDGMQKIADHNGMGKQVAADRDFYRRYIETFRDPASPVVKALNSKETGDFARAFVGKDKSGVQALGQFSGESAKAVDSLRKLHADAESTPKPKTLLPKLETTPSKKINIKDIQNAKLKSLQGRANWITHRGAWAATWPVLYALKDILHGNIGGVPGALAEGAATYGAVRGLAGMLTRPEVMDFLTKATAKDIAQVPADLRGDLPKIINAAQKQGIKVSPELVKAIGAGVAVAQPKGVARALTPIGASTSAPTPSIPTPVYMAAPNAKGLVKPGNININDRPIVQNGKDSSTVWSTSFGTDDGEVLVPRVTDGEDGKPPHLLSEHEALEYYKKYGKFLGIFDNPDDADAYGEALHEQQAKLGNRNGRTVAK